MNHWLQSHRLAVSISILLLFYVVGLIGLNSAYAGLFAKSTPLILIISNAALFWNHVDRPRLAVVAMATLAALGFLVEVLGVHTGLIFGAYHYGLALGTQLWDVPLVIGLNWLMLVATASVLVAKIPMHRMLQAVAGAVLLTGLDVLIEPVAIRLGFWQWVAGTPPLQNYIGWFLISFIFIAAWLFLPIQKENRLAGPLILLQFIFFAILNFTT
jgi:putative membrane protein